MNEIKVKKYLQTRIEEITITISEIGKGGARTKWRKIRGELEDVLEVVNLP